MKKLLGTLVLVGGLSISGSLGANASMDKKANADENVNSVELSWSLEGKSYKIYRDQKLIWSGDKKEYLDDNLNSNHLYSYKIGAFDENGDLIEITNLKTKTQKNKDSEKSLKSISKSSNKEISENTMDEFNLESNVGLDYVNLSWSPVEDVDGIYEVYRDSKLIGETKDLSYTDKNVERGTSYTYEVVAKHKVSKEKQKLIKEELSKKNLKPSKKEKAKLFEQQQSVIRIIETVEENTIKELSASDLPEEVLSKDSNQILSAAATSASSSSYMFRYTAFIPQNTVINPLKPGTYLHGDNRSWDPFSNKYRTRSDVIAGWAFGNYIDHYPSVGETIMYDDAAGTIELDRDRASSSGIKIYKDLVGSTKQMWRIKHDVGVPFSALYPNLNYYYEGTLYNNGSFEVRGAHDKAPNHEFYFSRAYTSGTPLTIFRHTGGNPLYLVPGAPQTYFEISM